MVLGLSTSSDNALYWYRSASLVLAPVIIYRTMFVCLIKMLILDLSIIVIIEPMYNSSYLYLAKTQI